ncbi:uncharacterized protein LOC114933291 [Nylanderia fulva]|uniref:uncharacterized protein LOC114933291 n=1 Tax=Nylanderia fulva TaxID=613905 RepID=UPI0010FB7774|nr:uncharacterized protein LOC114933291 [Nylanderia fulva]
MIKIPRWTGQGPQTLALEIHGFADASNRAYAAVVYLRVYHSLSDFAKNLIAAKTKVAPVKTLVGTPIHCWTDSTIALAWLRQHPSKWNTYVANRVAEIQNNLPSTRWSHVPSAENPADCASRGLSASELVSHSLWWTGPPWLRQPSTAWPIHDMTNTRPTNELQQVSAELRKTKVLHIEGEEEWDLLYKFSSWTKLVRVTAYVHRFLALLRKEKRRAFKVEFKTLQKTATISKKSSLRTFAPFLGKDSVLRLGGRLRHSALSYDEQHPVIVPRGQLAYLLIAQAHKSTLHGGVQIVLRTLRQNYWLMGGRNSVKGYIRQCIPCVRHSAKLSSQFMGDLPSPRVNPSSPFAHTGVDYAGPFLVTPFVGRGQKTRKNYIALFICLVTKAIHVELVEDYSSAGFLAAFRRFVSRRGLPSKLYSDNGTNFHGADKELNDAFSALMKDSSLHDILANDKIEWNFIPSAAPHFGGLWEAGIKSLKSHLKRVAGSRTLSQAEFATLLCQIEACLNSRPIAALSDDPSDLSALTPGHFLIGRPIIAIPEESVLESNANRLSRWQMVHSLVEQIWRSWSQDYLHSLQQRRKWSEKTSCFRIGELALLKNPLLPPSKWNLARVTQIHPGSDGLVRVVTVRTASSILKRPITLLCRLPINSNI